MSILAQSLALGSADYSWRTQANCRDTDPELFFPIGNTGEALRMLSRARLVCADCTVKASCLEFAMTTNQDCGVWGGTSATRRESASRRRYRPACRPRRIRRRATRLMLPVAS
ncbi:MAG: WhiB family transcriptional regulator [Actinobacteria bacterium]|nr:WhiB family transcriptional regulator [Actinomycetota bacterium]